MQGASKYAGWLPAVSLVVAGLISSPVLADETVHLGLSAPITGDQAQYGIDIRAGAELAVQQLNDSNMVPGFNFDMTVEDSKGDPKEAANVAQKLTSSGNISAVVGDFSSTATLAAAPIYQRAGVVEVTPTASHPDITKTGDYIFRDTPIAATEVNAVADWATKDLGYKKIGVIARNDDYGRSYGDLFKQRSEANGATVVGVEYFNPSDNDMKPLITKMRSAGPDAVLLALFQVEAAQLFQQSVEMNFHPVFFSGAGLFNPQLITLAGDAANGLLMVTTYLPENPKPAVQSFVKAYQAKYNAVPSKFAAHAYVAVNLIADAVKRAGSAKSSDIRDALAATKDFESAIGTISIDPNREVILDLTRIEVKDQKFVPYTGK